jgi:hypothetical protein
MKGFASQKFVPIKSIREGIVSLDNNEYRAVIMVSSLNLSLKSEDEQSAILSQFQNFFNSLDFPIQIYSKSRRADIEPYLKSLEERIKQVDGELLKLQIVEYIEYIKSFTSESNIMTKQFYVIIPYTAPTISTGGMMSFSGSKGSDLDNFYKIREQVSQRASQVKSGLTRCGLKTVDMGTEELIELYYSILNPGGESKSIM